MKGRTRLVVFRGFFYIYCRFLGPYVADRPKRANSSYFPKIAVHNNTGCGYIQTVTVPGDFRWQLVSCLQLTSACRAVPAYHGQTLHLVARPHVTEVAAYTILNHKNKRAPKTHKTKRRPLHLQHKHQTPCALWEVEGGMLC